MDSKSPESETTTVPELFRRNANETKSWYVVGTRRVTSKDSESARVRKERKIGCRCSVSEKMDDHECGGADNGMRRKR